MLLTQFSLHKQSPFPLISELMLCVSLVLAATASTCLIHRLLWLACILKKKKKKKNRDSASSVRHLGCCGQSYTFSRWPHSFRKPLTTVSRFFCASYVGELLDQACYGHGSRRQDSFFQRIILYVLLQAIFIRMNEAQCLNTSFIVWYVHGY